MTARLRNVVGAAAAVAVLIAGPPMLRIAGAPGVLAYLLSCALAAAIAAAVLTRAPSGPCRPTGQEAAAVLALGTLSCWVLGTLVYRILEPDGREDPVPTHQAWLAAGIALVLAPVVEELLFRGALQRTLRDLSPHRPQIAVLVSTSVFALAHHRPAYLLAVAGLGLLCGLAAALGNSLLPAVAVHMGFNAATMLVPSAHMDALASGPAAAPVVVVSASAFAASALWLWRRALPA